MTSPKAERDALVAALDNLAAGATQADRDSRLSDVRNKLAEYDNAVARTNIGFRVAIWLQYEDKQPVLYARDHTGYRRIGRCAVHDPSRGAYTGDNQYVLGRFAATIVDAAVQAQQAKKE